MKRGVRKAPWWTGKDAAAVSGAKYERPISKYVKF